MLLCLLAPAEASASHPGGTRAWQDCARDGDLDATDYTQRDLQHALAEMPTDLEEYSNCPDVITEAIRLLAQGRRGSGLGGGAFGGIGPDGFGLGTDFQSPTPREREELAQAQRGGGSRPIPIGDTSVFPGGAGLGAKAASHPLPTSLLILLILLGLGLAARSIPAVRQLLPVLGPRLRPITDRVFPRRSA
jgi:hypothetical protein